MMLDSLLTTLYWCLALYYPMLWLGHLILWLLLLDMPRPREAEEVLAYRRSLARNAALNDRCVRRMAAFVAGLPWAMEPLREPCIPAWQPRPPTPPPPPPDPDDELFTASGLLLPPPAPGPRRPGD